jgi:hypothetical protein
MLSHLTRLNFPSRNLGENHLHLPLPVMRLLSSLKCEAKKNWGHGFKIDLIVAGPAGFTLPCNIGDLSPAITTLELSSCHLTGCFRFFSHTFCLSVSIILLQTCVRHYKGEIPASIGQLTNLSKLDLDDNNLSGKMQHMIT